MINQAMQPKRSILFINEDIADYQTLIDGVKPGTEVHMLDIAQGGLVQIAKILTDRSGIDAIHIISHGSAGRLLIGSTPVTGANLQDYSDELTAIGNALSPDGDILLYGCHVGAGAQGAAFVAALADATGANVAASSNPTGAAALGGDWQLEIQTGAIRSSIALTRATTAGYGHIFTVENYDSDPLGGLTPSSFTLNGFTYTMSGGDGGSFDWVTGFGVGGSGTLVPQSTSANSGTTETLTITYAGNATFLFSSIAVYFGVGGFTYTFTGKLAGGTVATTSSAAAGNAFQTISFGSATAIDQLIITSVDFNPSTESIDDFSYTLAPTITSATYDANTNSLVVTGANMTATAGVTNDIDVTKLTLTGQGGATYTLTSSNVEITSATGFTVTLNAVDQINVEGLLNKNGTSAIDATTFNIAAAADWNPSQTGNADTTGNAVTVSNVQTPAITSATYDASTGILVVTGSNLVKASGATNDIPANKFTFTGEGGSTYALTDTANVEITSGTAFTLMLSATDKAAINQIINKNSTSSTGATTYNLAAADDWNTVIGNANIQDLTGNGITASNVAVPTITSATYDASTGSLVVTGTGFLKLSGATNDIVANKFTFTGEGGSTYVLTDTANVEITSGTAFTVTLSATDKAAINQIINKNGTSSTGATTYNLAAAEDWTAGADAAVTVADLTGNGITASNVAAPTITSATYDAATGSLVVTGTSFLKLSGATNDIVANKFTFTGEGGSTYALTDTANVEITSGTAFTVTLSATDKAAINQIINKSGTSSTGATTYNLAAAEDWTAGADAAVNVVDATGNGITVSSVAVPAITSATYNYSTNALVVTGTGFLKLSGATNDIDISKLTFTGEGGVTYTLTSASDVEIDSGTQFTVTLSGADLYNVEALLNKDGTSAVSATTYNLAAAEDWTAGADAAVNVVDATGNGITVSNYAVPTVTSATYDVSTGQLSVTGTNFVNKSGATNDIDASLFTFSGESSNTYTLTDTTDVEISSATSFTLTLSSTDKLNIHGLLNKNGTASGDSTTYNLAAAEDWMPGAPSANTVADTAGNGITVSNVQTPTIISATYDSDTGILVVTGSNLFNKAGTNNDIDISTLTFTGGAGNATYTLTSASDIEITSTTSFSITLSGSDKTNVDALLDQIGTASSGGSTYNLSAADNWLIAADSAANIADTSNAVTVTINPRITSAAYDASTGSLAVTGTNLQANGGGFDIDASKLSFTGEGDVTYVLTDSADVEISSGTAFTVTLSTTDKAAINQIINKNGTASTGATTYNLAAADDWNTNVTAGNTVDMTGNGITASNVAAPTITSATYDAATGSLVVTGTGFLSKSGATNDIVANKFTFTGEGGSTYALTDTANVEITSGTAFTLILSATDKAAINQIINKNGTSSTGATTYNLAAAEDWTAGADAAVTVADLTGNGITASNVAVPTITSSTYNTGTGALVVTGTGFLRLSGATNDIVANKFTFTGEGGATYSLTDTANVEVTSGTTFTLLLSATDKTAVNLLLNKDGTSSTDATTYNLAAAEDWTAGADAAINVVDATGNGITTTIPVSSSGGGGGTPTTAIEIIDGVDTETTIQPDGTVVTTVKPVEPTREEDPESLYDDYADIPLATDEDGNDLLTVSLPVGIGMTVEGLPQELNPDEAKDSLVQNIKEMVDRNNEENHSIAGVKRFIKSLKPDEQITVQTVTLTTNDDQLPELPILVTGTADDSVKQALIIDVSKLPSGTIIQLDNVDFAVIIGAARLKGGNGNNYVIGDDQKQFIVLGEGDDILSGGGGDDIIGSLSGNDEVSGDEGNDVVFGGANHDWLSGGTGNDQLNGGFGFDQADQSGQLSDYQIAVQGNSVTLTDSAGEIDTLTDVELVHFASGASLAIAHSEIEAVAHHLAKTWFGRDLTTTEGDIVQNWAGDTDDLLTAFYNLPEAADLQNKTAGELLAGLETNPNIIRLDVTRDVAAVGTDIEGYLSLGLAQYVDNAAGHDVLRMIRGRDDVNLESIGDTVELTRLSDGAMLDLRNTEMIAFDTGETVVFAHNTTEGILARLVHSFFDRDATAAEWRLGREALNAQMSPDAILDWFQQQAGLENLSDTDYVQTIYTHTLGRQATSAELSEQLLRLENNQINRGWLAVEIAESAEAGINLIGSVMLQDGWV